MVHWLLAKANDSNLTTCWGYIECALDKLSQLLTSDSSILEAISLQSRASSQTLQHLVLLIFSEFDRGTRLWTWSTRGQQERLVYHLVPRTCYISFQACRDTSEAKCEEVRARKDFKTETNMWCIERLRREACPLNICLSQKDLIKQEKGCRHKKEVLISPSVSTINGHSIRTVKIKNCLKCIGQMKVHFNTTNNSTVNQSFFSIPLYFIQTD